MLQQKLKELRQNKEIIVEVFNSCQTAVKIVSHRTCNYKLLLLSIVLLNFTEFRNAYIKLMF